MEAVYLQHSNNSGTVQDDNTLSLNNAHALWHATATSKSLQLLSCYRILIYFVI